MDKQEGTVTVNEVQVLKYKDIVLSDLNEAKIKMVKAQTGFMVLRDLQNRNPQYVSVAGDVSRSITELCKTQAENVREARARVSALSLLLDSADAIDHFWSDEELNVPVPSEFLNA